MIRGRASEKCDFNCIHLNYSCMPEEKIVKGMTILGEVIKENLKK